VPVLPPDADARRIFVEHLLDHSCPARLRGSFGLDDDPVSHLNVHLSRPSWVFGLPCYWEVSARGRAMHSGRDQQLLSGSDGFEGASRRYRSCAGKKQILVPSGVSAGSCNPISDACCRIAATSVLHVTSEGMVGGCGPSEAEAPVTPPAAITKSKISISFRIAARLAAIVTRHCEERPRWSPVVVRPRTRDCARRST
jgi:hypothetical protein